MNLNIEGKAPIELLAAHFLGKKLWGAMRGLIRRVVSRPRRRKLRVLDVTSFGEKRFVAIVRCGRENFLIGGSANSVSLLTKLVVPKSRSLASVQIEPRDRFVS
jgi:flagellar biogenesis protein FliO